jgi:hypothetical protein
MGLDRLEYANIVAGSWDDVGGIAWI